ncbi:MAG: VirB8/TrbF family protein, partial [Limnobacter sp.]
MSFKQQMAGLANGLKNLTTKRKPEDLIDHQNPYITARRTWNDHVGSVISAKQTWQFLGIFCLLLMLVSLGGVIHIGSQSKFVPYVVQVDKQGQTVAMGPVSPTTTADPRVVHAAVSNFITDARMVTPDAALQRKAVFRVYSM